MTTHARRERERGPPERRALVCCVLAALAIAGGLGLQLSRADPRRSGTNGVWVRGEAPVGPGGTACQDGELLPAGTTAARIAGVTNEPPVVVVRRGGRELDRVRATLVEGGIAATIAPPARDLTGVEICLQLGPGGILLGGPTPPHVGGLTIDGAPAGSSVQISYLLPGERSWWSIAPTIAERVGRGRGEWTAGWTAWLIGALVVASLALTGVVVVRTIVGDRVSRRTPAAILAIAILNAATWSFISPAFQIPDEIAHVAYVQSIGETGRPHPDPNALALSPEQRTAMADAGYGSFEAPTLHAAAWSALQQQRLERDLREPLGREAGPTIGEAEPQPPLYYALEGIPYRAASGATLLDRLTLMRLLSASFAGVTALLCFLFVRECLPGRPWAWTVGGLGVAFAPMLGFISGGVNPDGLAFPLAAALFLCVARGWRRGVTLRLASTIGVLIAVGMLVKVNVYGLVPGTLLGLTLAARRSVGAWDLRVLRPLGACVALAVVVFAAGVGFQSVAWDRSLAVGRPSAPESHVGLWGHFSYVWQVFLPALPGQPPTTLTRPGYEQLFETFVGTFGWVTVRMPSWSYQAAAVVLALVAALAVRMLGSEPRTLRRRAGEAIGYLAMAGTLMVMIGLFADLRRHLLHIVQGRYLLPLLALFALLLALGARGAGERWGRAAGVAIVALAVAWSLSCQLVTIAFFYS